MSAKIPLETCFAEDSNTATSHGITWQLVASVGQNRVGGMTGIYNRKQYTY